jgi:hypothetical protein
MFDKMFDDILDEPEVEPVVYETIEDAIAAHGDVPVVGPDESDDDVPFGETDEPN